jgi:hypothetical protein
MGSIMRMTRLWGIAVLTAAELLVGGAANAAPAPPACGYWCSSPVVDGSWVWLPSVGIPEWLWAFFTPGSGFSQLLWFPA